MNTPKQSGRLTVQVVAVAAELGFHKTMLVPQGQTLGWCLNASGIYGLHPHLQSAKFGLWGKRAKPETILTEGDRIEVYQPVTSTKKSRKKS